MSKSTIAVLYGYCVEEIANFFSKVTALSWALMCVDEHFDGSVYVSVDYSAQLFGRTPLLWKYF